jgi:hypothetical protein
MVTNGDGKLSTENMSWVPASQEEKLAVQEQLEQILSHPLFRNSKRCLSFLRYVVDCSLQGKCSQIKERVLGVEVFGRDPEYDTNQDHIVRATAIEVRKRIAQYYHEPDHEGEIRVDLPPGSYVPEFRLPARTMENQIDGAEKVPAASGQVSSSQTAAPSSNSRSTLILLGLVLGVGVLLLVAALWSNRASKAPISSSVQTDAAISSSLQTNVATLDLFWKPFLAPSGSILLCVGTSQVKSMKSSSSESILLGDAKAVATLSRFLGQKNRICHVKTARATTYDDQRQGPNILIGRFDNPWTTLATEALRFRFQTSADSNSVWIEDVNSSPRKRWPASGAAEEFDYSILVRTVDTSTGRPSMIVAGLTDEGTFAAASCLVGGMCMNSLPISNAGDWTNKNIEAVVETRTIEGSAGSSRIVALQVW